MGSGGWVGERLLTPPPRICAQLCEAGADVNVADLAGQRPADLAGRNNPGKREDARALLATYAARAAAA